MRTDCDESGNNKDCAAMISLCYLIHNAAADHNNGAILRVKLSARTRLDSAFIAGSGEKKSS